MAFNHKQVVSQLYKEALAAFNHKQADWQHNKQQEHKQHKRQVAVEDADKLMVLQAGAWAPWPVWVELCLNSS